MPETVPAQRDCERCSRPFDVPLSGPGKVRRLCFDCSPSRTAQPVAAIAPQPTFSSDMERKPFPDIPFADPEYVGPFQKKAEHILAKYPDCDEAKALAALALAKALDSTEVTGAQIGGLVTKWLAIMEAIKNETPSEPDIGDELTESIRRKMAG